MEYTQIWEYPQQIEEAVDRLYAESDRKAHEIMQKIAELAIRKCA